jgi:hypothetical protein
MGVARRLQKGAKGGRRRATCTALIVAAEVNAGAEPLHAAASRDPPGRWVPVRPELGLARARGAHLSEAVTRELRP